MKPNYYSYRYLTLLNRNKKHIIQCTLCKREIDLTKETTFIACFGYSRFGEVDAMKSVDDVCTECCDAMHDMGFLDARI